MWLRRRLVLPLLLAVVAPGPVPTTALAEPAQPDAAPPDSPAADKAATTANSQASDSQNPNGLIYVLNSGEANILVLDGASREEVRRIAVLREVHHLALTPKGDMLLVGDSGANEMLFINPLTGEMVKREALSNPYHMGFSPDGKKLVVTSLRRDQVDIYDWDGAALTLKARLRMPDMPSHVAFSPDSKMAYVTLQGIRALAAISLETSQPAWTLDVGPQPAGVTWHEGRLLIGIMGSDHVAVVNPETRLTERTIKAGRGAHAIFPAPPRDGKPGLLYVTSRVDSRITVLDPATLGIVKVLDVPGGPDCVTFDPNGKLWVTQRWIGRIALVDPESGALEGFRVGRSPHGILFEPTARPTATVGATATAPVPVITPASATEARPAAVSSARTPSVIPPAPPTPPPASGRRLFTPRSPAN
jgi:DNA-binding beta-propeller fold protein YncE